MTSPEASILAAVLRPPMRERLEGAAEDLRAFLAYLNEGLYAARELDCASQPTPTTTATPSATPTAAPVPTSSAGTDTPGGEGVEGLALTGATPRLRPASAVRCCSSAARGI